ncbi:MAG: hypothetical protein AB1652_07415 [Bacillota bacterium]
MIFIGFLPAGGATLFFTSAGNRVFAPNHDQIYIGIPSRRLFGFLSLNNSPQEPESHCRILDAMRLDERAKLITHVGGGYSNKEDSLEKFIKNWARIPREIARRPCMFSSSICSSNEQKGREGTAR